MSGEAAKQYNPSAIVIDVGGKQASGFAEGSFVTVSEEADRVMVVTGTDGSVVFSRVEVGIFTVTIKLIQASDFNDVLDTIAETNRIGPGLLFKKFAMRDLFGRALHLSPAATVGKIPEADYDKSAKPREWKLLCTFGQNRILGSTPVVAA